MRSADSAALLLRATRDIDSAGALLRFVGFENPPLPLDAAACGMLGRGTRTAAVARGPGLLRGLAIDTHRGNARECAIDTARELSRRAPHLLPLLVVVEPDSDALVIAAWRFAPHGSAPLISALTVDRNRIAATDAETLLALRGCADITPDLLRHLRWLDILGRDTIGQRFFQGLRRAVEDIAASFRPMPRDEDDARTLALLLTSRLLFLSFLEPKGWLDGDFGFLANGFATCMADGGCYHRRTLDALFFGTLNTAASKRAPRARRFGRVPFLNGGLFTRTPLERTHRRTYATDEAIGGLFGNLLTRFRFTARESATAWEHSAIDPEMLGRSFEALMPSDDRKSGGVYFTPQAIVEDLTRAALVAALEPHANPRTMARLLDGRSVDGAEGFALTRALRGISILDPACGSGAFLVHALDRISSLLATLGDTRPLAAIRRDALVRSIFGVDRLPIAVWLCQLRLWLSVVVDTDVDDPMRVVPLPNLDHSIRVGDSLADTSGVLTEPSDQPESARRLRARYARATGRRKSTLGRMLHRCERAAALAALDARLAHVTTRRRELVSTARSPELFARRTVPRDVAVALRDARATVRALRATRRRIVNGEALPFSYSSHFPDVATRGFDLILGNPPWLGAHHLPAHARNRYAQTFTTLRNPGWPGAPGGRSRFASGGDVAALFVERSLSLARPGGIVALLVPGKLWRSIAGGGVRTLIETKATLVSLDDRSDAPAAFEAATYPSLLVLRRPHISRAAMDTPCTAFHVARGTKSYTWRSSLRETTFDATPGGPWILAPPEVRAAFRTLSDFGVPFHSRFGVPRLGVKTGCNEAFVFSASGAATSDNDAIFAHSRPAVRGETIRSWHISDPPERVLWTHDRAGRPLARLPTALHTRLAPFRHALESRSDARRGPWWSLFRLDGADDTSYRVAWNDIGRRPRVAIIPPGDPTVVMNTCYVVTTRVREDALALTALLESRVTAAWLATLAEPARGGHFRFMAWTVALMPLPADWQRACELLAPFTEHAMRTGKANRDDLDDAVLSAFGIERSVIPPLLAWHAAPVADVVDDASVSDGRRVEPTASASPFAA